MKRTEILSLMLLFTTALPAQNSIPKGTILPVELNSSLNSGKNKVGQAIWARIMQDVPLPGGAKIRAGTKVVGQVMEVEPAGSGNGASLALRFEEVVISHRRIAITSNLRALASAMEVWDAQIPLTGPDRGTPESAWTTVQVGGDVVYRGGGPVTSEMEVVGEPTYKGVLARTSSCQGGASDNEPQALWVFSSNACGVYGLRHVSIVHSGRTDPVGEIELASDHGEVKVDKASGILLRVKSSTER